MVDLTNKFEEYINILYFLVSHFDYLRHSGIPGLGA